MISTTSIPLASQASMATESALFAPTEALVVRIRSRRRISQAERKRLMRQLCRDMHTAGMAMATSRGWCVFTSTNGEKLSVLRHQVLNWLIDHEQFDKYALFDPVSTQEVFADEVDLSDEQDPLWRQPPVDVPPLVRNLTRWSMWHQHVLKGRQAVHYLATQGVVGGEGA